MRALLLATALIASVGSVAGVAADEAAWNELRGSGAVLVLRHAATVPGIGDPPGFRLDDCASQRNLSAEGREQAAAIGRSLREQGVSVVRVESSRWCRCLETARLAFPQLQVQPLAALDSFFADRAAGPAQTSVLRNRVRDWQGPGVLVLVSHQVNITALTGQAVAAGEGVVLRPEADGFRVVGSVRF